MPPRSYYRTWLYPGMDPDDPWGSTWRTALSLMHAAVINRGRRCQACGRFLFRRGTRRVYCGDRCRARATRRRERIRHLLVEYHAACPMCGSRP